MAEPSADRSGGEENAPEIVAPAPSEKLPRGAGVSRSGMALAGAALIAWFGFLLYEALATANPVIVSRPQVLAAPVVVEGTVTADPPRVRVDRVWKGDPSLQGAELVLDRLPSLLDGAGKVHVLPLESVSGGEYRVFPIPVEPPFSEPSGAKDRIYPASDSVRHQLEAILTPSRDRQRPEGAQ